MGFRTENGSGELQMVNCSKRRTTVVGFAWRTLVVGNGGRLAAGEELQWLVSNGEQ